METLQQQNERITEYRRTIEKKTCTIKELSEYFGVSEARARQLTRIEDFPKIKFGRNVRIVVDKLDGWLDEHIGECM